MIKRLIITVILASALLTGFSIFETTYHTTITNEVAVNQVEDSDESFIAAKHVDSVRKGASIFVLFTLIGGIYLIWSKPLHRYMQMKIEERKEKYD